MKKKFVLTLALVLMVAASLMAATPLEVSGSFKSGYKYVLDFDGANTADQDPGQGAEAKVNADFTGDFWKVSLTGDAVEYGKDKLDATAAIYLDKALAEQGMDMGDIALTLHIGDGVDGDLPTVLADKAEFRKDAQMALATTGKNFGITLGYADLFTVYATVDPTLAALPMAAGVTLDPVEGITAAVGFTNDYAGNNGLTVSAKADVAKLAGLDFALAATGEMMLDIDASTTVITADVATTIEGIGLWAAYQKTATDVNKMAVKASYSTKVNEVTVGAGVKFAVTDLSDLANKYEVTVDGSASYAMGGVTYALAADYKVKAQALTIKPTVAISF